VLPINSNPVELDSTPVSPVSRKESWKIKGLAATGSTMVSPDLDEEAYGELSGEKGVNEVVREVRGRQTLTPSTKLTSDIEAKTAACRTIQGPRSLD
jgi:hypothetical protein